MNNITLTMLLIVLISPQSFSQTLGLQVTDNFKGKNATIFYEHVTKNKSIVYGGAIFHINEGVKNNLKQQYAYKKRFKANSTFEHFGLEIGYRKSIKTFSCNNILYVDFNSQATYLSIDNYLMLNGQDIEGTGHPYEGQLKENMYVKEDIVYGPVFSIENNVGISYYSQFTEKLNLTISIGSGTIYIKDTNNNVAGGSGFDWFTHRISLSIGYSIKKT
jgi:hypothetical protein